MLSRAHAVLFLAAVSLAACDRPAADHDPATPTPPSRKPETVDLAVARDAPEPFRGVWSADLAACGGGGIDDSRLVIEARRIQFYEGGGSIIAVKPAGPREATLETRLSSEGETFERAYRFRLSPDGRTLTDLAGGFARRRCPG